MQICSFISNQPCEFPWEYGNNPKAHNEYIKQLKQAIATTVEMDEVTTFCCCMLHSVDLDFAEAVLYQRENKYPNIRLICVVENKHPNEHWNERDAKRYESILSKADEKQSSSPIQILKTSSQFITVWNEQKTGATWDSLCYAMQQSKSVYFIRLNDIKEDTDEPNGKLKRELREAEEASKRSMFTRLAYTLLIKELIAGHPDPKSAFKTAIKNNPAFKNEISRLANTMELDALVD